MRTIGTSNVGRLLSRRLAEKSQLISKAETWRDSRQRVNIPLSCQLHAYTGGLLPDREDEKRKPSFQVAHYHATPPDERAVAIMLSLGALSAGSYAASNAVKAYNEWKASLPEEPEEPPVEQVKEEQGKAEKKEEKTTDGKRENVFAKWFGVGVGAKYYEGGFEEEMTRREAALILGVRESSSPQRVKEAHRKLLILNHPDTGGSTYISGKINEAKELLLKGKRA